ncbi:MAG TPA: O-antigen ligase family protein [Vicinamibacterales bacterium]|nr:O-antigen ligase family protein [Vicinamibacterales bacterium]
MDGVVAAPRSLALERAALGSMLLFTASLQVSIFAAQVFLALTALLWLALVIIGRERIQVPPMFWPLLAYAGISLVSAAFSIDPRVSIVDSKQLLLFTVVPIAYRLLRGGKAMTAIDVIISVGAISAAIGIIQFGILKFDDLGLRPRGTLGMYMTYSGQLMLVACVAAARVLFRRGDRVWPLLVLAALIVALTTTLSRNAWVGACAGIGLLFLIRDFRLFALVPVMAALFFAFAPARISDRLWSMIQIKDTYQQTATTEASVHSNRDRLAMAKSGFRIIKDRPLTGVGPDMIIQVYPVYRDKDAVNQLNPHLHNVPLQIAAERGLPALMIWIWFVVTLVRDLLRLRRGARWSFLPNAGLACVAAMLAAGMFEHNFGDSEFLMLFLLLMTLPYSAELRPVHESETA